jgi:hypothetical protein
VLMLTGIRRWWRARTWGYRLAMREPPGRHGVSPLDLSEALRSCPGKWVALRQGKMVEVRDTPYALVQALHERDIADATIIRAPDPSEPELVGLG